MSKPKPELVHSSMAREAYRRAGEKSKTEHDRKQRAWSEYIRLKWQTTGNLAPGCDAKDFYAWVDLNG